MRRFWIEGDIELGRRGDVAVRGHRRTHHHAARNSRWQAGVEFERQRQIGQRAQCHQQQVAGVFVRQPQNGQRRVFGLGCARGRGIAGIAKAIAAMHIGGIARGEHQGRIGAGKYRHIHGADFTQFQRVGDGVRKTHIAGGNGQAHHFMLRVVEGHQQSQRVVHAGVGIDE